MASWEGNLIRVRLVDVQLNKLGVTLHDRDTPPKVQVKDLQEGGMLEKCGLVSEDLQVLLKRKCDHFDKIFAICCIASCHFDRIFFVD